MFILLHWLGGSARTWSGISGILAERGVQCVAIDLPGFGDAAGVAGYDVRGMSDAVIETIVALRNGMTDLPWLIAGHSMGGKVASVVARASLDGAEGLQGLLGVVLVSPSPPAPEPMKESKREQMLASLGESSNDADEDCKRAGKFVDENTGLLSLPETLRQRAVDDVLRMNRTAFRAWLGHGSREDWSEHVGVLTMPAMIFAGTKEEALGPEVQQEQMLPHFAAGSVVSLEGAGHLAPLERPMECAEHICEFMRSLGVSIKNTSAELAPSFQALLVSDRTSPQTRDALEQRLHNSADWNYAPQALTQEEFRTLRALTACVVPKAGFDIAAAVDRNLAECKGDGWRFAALPHDLAAWKKGLASLDSSAERAFHVSFLALDLERQNELLHHARSGELGQGVLGALHMGEGADAYTSAEMKQWFEEARSEFTKLYMAHPSTMQCVGYTGFADEAGFTQIELGEREEFER